MFDENLYKTDSEGIELLKFIFTDSVDLYKKLAPDGWERSEYVHFLHPTPEQQFEEHKRISSRLNALGKKSTETEEEKYTLNDFTQDDLDNISAYEEFLYILGLTVYDVFSNNHEVVGSDNKIYDFGSFRGSAGFIAEFLNQHYPNPNRCYDYLDFYMGTIWIKSRGDLSPFYEFVFQKLKESNCNWNYTFPRIYLIDFKKDTGSSDSPDPEKYNPEVELSKELKMSKRKEETNKLRKKLDEAYEEEFEEAKYKPLETIVKAYKNVYGILPEGHPKKEFE